MGPNPNEKGDFPSELEQQETMRLRKLEAKGKISKMAIETEDGKYEGGMRQVQIIEDKRVCVCDLERLWVSVCFYVCVCVCVRVRVHEYIHVYICIYIHMYTYGLIKRYIYAHI